MRMQKLAAGILGLGKNEDMSRISPWNILKDRSIADVPAMQQMSASYYHLMVAMGAVGLLASLMIIAIKIMWAKNPQSRNSCKDELMFKVLVGIAVFSYVTLIGMLYGAVNKLA